MTAKGSLILELLGFGPMSFALIKLAGTGEGLPNGMFLASGSFIGSPSGPAGGLWPICGRPRGFMSALAGIDFDLNGKMYMIQIL